MADDDLLAEVLAALDDLPPVFSTQVDRLVGGVWGHGANGVDSATEDWVCPDRGGHALRAGTSRHRMPDGFVCTGCAVARLVAHGVYAPNSAPGAVILPPAQSPTPDAEDAT